MLDVFQHEGVWALRREYSFDLKKQRALRLVSEAVGSIQTVFFGNPGNREGLTGKACTQEIMSRNRYNIDLPYVPGRDYTEVLFI